jgi:hypothetical protein
LFLLTHFLQFQIQDDGVIHRFIISESTPLARLNDKVDVAVPTVKEIATSESYSLFSSNAMVQIVGYGYPILKRDDGAPVYPNHYTCPAGRCEEPPLKTALAELNQEIAITIRHQKTGELRLLGYGNKEAAEAGKLHKQKGMKRELPEVQVVPLNWEEGLDRYELWLNCGSIYKPTSKCLEKGSATIVYDRDTNTYELCFIATITLPEGWEIYQLEDGEGYGREVSFVTTLNELKDKPCVPALNAFIK